MGSFKLIGEQEGGSDDHAALSNLDFLSAGHTGFLASDGIPGGQTAKGGTGVGEHLTLQSTAHATRGYVRTQDDLQLLSNVIRDSGGNNRLQLAASSPHLTVTGDPRINGWLAIRSAPAANQLLTISPSETWTGGPVYMVRVQPGGSIDANTNLFALSLSATSAVASGRTVTEYKGVVAALLPAPSGTIANLGALEGGLGTFSGFGGGITTARGLRVYLAALGWFSIKPTTVVGLEVEDMGHASVTTAYGLRLADQSGGTVRLLELGPATPYLRLAGGANPGANLTNLYLNEGGTLRRVQVKDGAAIGSGDRVMVLV